MAMAAWTFEETRSKSHELIFCVVMATLWMAGAAVGMDVIHDDNSDGFVSLAAAPAAASTSNITGLLDKAGQFTTLISLLGNTHVDSQLQIQLNNSQQGLTILAPTDSAFGALRPGALNSITDQQKIAFLQYHVLSSFYTLSQFQTISNPVSTLASGNGGKFTLNVTAFGSQVNVSTGLVNTAISNTIMAQKPIAVYEVDRVLLPEELFGAKSPACAPPPEAGGPSSIGAALSPSPAGFAATSASNPTVRIFYGTGIVVFVRLFACIVSCFLLLSL